ncbi:hypothetical protein [Paenibacillus assamensis]|uniref:hypothetical protein n=1 Tax=Paenibacillus assamensis TaxID=311244 RepID=UPI00040E3448|nr:hypothetical protein [Paenibacillus assamensis]
MEAKKQSIMEETLALFAENGYHQTYKEELERLIIQSLDQFSRFKLFVSFQRKEVHLQQKKELRELIVSLSKRQLEGY